MIKYIKGDLFTHKTIDATKAIVLAHACNTGGIWGGGVAAVFRHKYPYANDEYSNYCVKHSNLLGKSLLIPATADGKNTKIYIGCLFTSDFSQSPEEIAQYTDESLSELSKQLKELAKEVAIETDEYSKYVVNMPKINAGIFGVPWEMTEEVLKKHPDLSFNVYVI